MNDLGLLTLLAVRLRSRGPVSVVTATVADLIGDSAAVGLSDEVATIVERMIGSGQLRSRGEEGRLSLTPQGDAELGAGLGADLDARERAEIMTAYQAFLPLNKLFLAACVSWQKSPTDMTPIADLAGRVTTVVDAAAKTRHRFASYSHRLADALAESEVDPRWIDHPSLDSVHTVWFELHEHLLATLGRDRTSE